MGEDKKDSKQTTQKEVQQDQEEVLGTIEEYIAQLQRPGKDCRICALGDNACNDVLKALAANDSGKFKSSVTIAQMILWLKKKYGYDGSDKQLTKHAQYCLERNGWKNP